MISLISFWIFFGLSLFQLRQRQFLIGKLPQDWFLDIFGLIIQGAIIPLLQIFLVLNLYTLIIPSWSHRLNLSHGTSFFIGFIVIDYIYYWVHRSLHSKSLFVIHKVHHTISQMDMVGAARNTIWSSLFLPYIWLNSLLVYLLQDPRGYIFAITLTYLLDLWRHSSLTISENSWLYNCLNPWLILPQDHGQHHSRKIKGNFGANLKIWDKFHNTYIAPLFSLESKSLESKTLGISLPLSLPQKLFWPFS
jgi:sterol desaturase/sphingolipid hydroxylase (fatty acid hydroxylase superfamily)